MASIVSASQGMTEPNDTYQTSLTLTNFNVITLTGTTSANAAGSGKAPVCNNPGDLFLPYGDAPNSDPSGRPYYDNIVGAVVTKKYNEPIYDTRQDGILADYEYFLNYPVLNNLLNDTVAEFIEDKYDPATGPGSDVYAVDQAGLGSLNLGSVLNDSTELDQLVETIIKAEGANSPINVNWAAASGIEINIGDVADVNISDNKTFLGQDSTELDLDNESSTEMSSTVQTGSGGTEYIIPTVQTTIANGQFIFSQNTTTNLVTIASDIQGVDITLGSTDLVTINNLGPGTTILAGAANYTLSVDTSGYLVYGASPYYDKGIILPLPLEVPLPTGFMIASTNNTLTSQASDPNVVIMNADDQSTLVNVENQIVIGAGNSDVFQVGALFGFGAVDATLIDLASSGGTLEISGINVIRLRETTANGHPLLDVIDGFRTLQCINITTIVGEAGLTDIELPDNVTIDPLSSGMDISCPTMPGNVRVINFTTGILSAVKQDVIIGAGFFLGGGSSNSGALGAGSSSGANSTPAGGAAAASKSTAVTNSNAAGGTTKSSGSMTPIPTSNGSPSSGSSDPVAGTFTLETGNGNDTITSSAENPTIVFGSGTDTLTQAGAGSVIEAGSGTDYFDLSNDVEIVGATANDVLTWAGQVLHGALEWGSAQGYWAVSGYNDVEYAIDSLGELEAKNILGDILTITDYVGGPGAAYDTAGIYVAVASMAAYKLLDPNKPNVNFVSSQFSLANAAWKALTGKPWFPGADPLVLDLTGNGLDLTGESPQSPLVDLNNDGFAVRTGWVKPDDGFLVWDNNGTYELFGAAGTSGFAALAADDSNKDGKINSADTIFSQLMVWQDLNGNGVIDPGELQSLSALGISAINVTGTASSQVVNGNYVTATGSFTYANGTTGEVGDVSFITDNFDTQYTGNTTVSAGAAAEPNLKGYGTLTDLQVAMTLNPALINTVKTALATMTISSTGPSLDALRNDALSVFAGWISSVPLTNASLAPGHHPDVWIELTNNGSQVNASDYLYTAVNPSNGATYYKLGSGKAVLDANGNVIAYPTFAQATATGNWVDLTGAELDFVERYWGSPIAIGTLLNNPTQYISVLLDTFTAAWNALNLETVRLAMQGPAASYFAGLAYDTKSDTFDVTTDTQLTPMFTAIFKGAPTNAAGATTWLNGWKPILDIIEGNLAPSQGLKATYGYLFASMVAAYEATNPALSINAVATALGIPASLIYDSGTTLQGATADANIIYAASGNQTLVGSGGPDNDVFGSNFGNDTINNQNVNQTPDILWFATLDPSDITASRNGVDLILTDNKTGSQITVLNEFIGFKPSLTGQNLNPVTGDQQIVFADGTVWNEPEIAYAAGLNTKGTNGTLQGTPANDVLDGNNGNTLLEGYGGGDIYLYDRGDGNDTILRSQQDILVTAPDVVDFGPGLTSADVTFTRAGDSPNLVVTVNGDTSDTLTILNQFDSTFTGVFGTQNLNQIDGFEFADGTQYSAAQVQLLVLAAQEAIPNNTIYGFDGADVIDPGVGGNDFMSGGNGDDTYLFGFGYGNDTIQDGMQNILSGTDDTVLFNLGVDPSKVSVVRNGDSSNFTLRLSDGSALTILGQFDNTWAGPFGNIQFNQIESFQFQDSAATNWTTATIEQMAIASQMAAGGAVYGFWNGAYFDPGTGGGNHTMIGEGGTNTYVFGLGYGSDTINDSSGGEVLFNADVNPGSVSYYRDSSGNLTIRLSDGSSLDIENEFHYQPYGLGDILANQVTTFQFQDSAKTTLTSGQISQNFISVEEGQKGGTVYGYFGGNVLSGAAGNETLIGVNGANTFLFGQGYGQETIVMNDDGYFWAPRDTGVVSFGQGITPTGVELVTNSTTGVLEVEFAGIKDTLIIENYAALLSPGFAGGSLLGFQFSDGTFWSAGEITTIIEQEQLSSGQHTQGSTLTGPFPDNFVDPGVNGDHNMVSPSGDVTYVFGLGYGYDTISDNSDGGSEVLFNANVSPSSVQFNRGGTSYWDLTITLADGSQIDIANEFLPTADGFGESLENDVGYFQFQDSAHTELTLAQIESDLISSEEAKPYSTIYSFYGGDTLSGASGNDTFIGVDGANTILFGLGDGNEFLSLRDDGYYYAPRATANIVFGSGITANSISLITDGITGDLSIRVNGTTDSLTVANYAALLSGNALSFQFSDGTVWNSAKITDVLETDALDVELAVKGGPLTGPFPNNYVDPGLGGGRDITSSGGIDTYVFGFGYGFDTIHDYSSGGSTVLFNPGVAPSAVQFTRGGQNFWDLTITLADGSQLDIANEFLPTPYGFGDSIENDVGYFRFQDSANTTLTYSEIESQLISNEEAVQGGTIYSFYGGDTRSGSAGDNTFVGVNGVNTILFGVGDGNEVLSLYDDGYSYSQRATANVVFSGAEENSLSFFTDGTSGNITVRINGTSDSLTILNGSGLLAESVLSFQFSDGTVWNSASISAHISASSSSALTWYGSTTNRNLVGSNFGPNIFYVAPGGDQITFGNAHYSGDNNIVNFGTGDGLVTVTPNGGIGTIDLGAGILPSRVEIDENFLTGNLMIELLGSNGLPTGDEITVLNDLSLSGTSNIASVIFANGVAEQIGVDQFYLSSGDGASTVNASNDSWGAGTVFIGPNITANEVIVESNPLNGNLTIALENASGSLTGTSLTILNDYNYNGGFASRIGSIVIGTGSTASTIAVTPSMTDTWVGSAANTTLVGSPFAANLFKLAAGGDQITFGNGSQNGSPINVVDFGLGDGVATANSNSDGWNDGTIVMGAGITASEVIFETDLSGDLTILLLNSSGKLTGDSLTILKDFNYNGGFASRVGNVVIGTGSTASTISIASTMTDTWIASSTNKTLVGSAFAANLFKLAAGGDSVTLGNGSQYGSPINVVDFGVGDGVATVNSNYDGWNDATIVMGSGITSSDVIFESDATGDLKILLLNSSGKLTGDSLMILNDMNYNGGFASRVGGVVVGTGSTASTIAITASMMDTWIASSTNQTLVGSQFAANLFELAAGGDHVTFGNGSQNGSQLNIVDFGVGDGSATINPNGVGWNAGTIVMGSSITAGELILESNNANGNLTIELLNASGTVTSDSITILGELNVGGGFAARVDDIVVGTGNSATTIAITGNTTDTWIASATNKTLIGSDFSANLFELAEGGDNVTFGNGSQNGSQINVVDFGVGDGAATVNSNGIGWNNGTIVMGAAITAGEILFQSDGKGDLTIRLLNASGTLTNDSLTILNDFNYNGGFESRVGDVVVGTGSIASTISITSTMTDTWIASATNTTLVGSPFAANLFELAPGSDHVTFGNGSQYGSQINVVDFGTGDGAATVTSNGIGWNEGTIVIGAGITASDVIFQSDGTGDLTIRLLNSNGTMTSDSLTILSDLNYNGGFESRVGSVVVGVGSAASTISITPSMTDTWIGSATNTTLVGSPFAANLFELAPGGDHVTFGNGSQNGSALNTVNFSVGDGAASISLNGGNGVIQFGAGITEKNLWFIESGNNLLIDVLGSSDQLTINGFVNSASAISEIKSSDGLEIDSQLNNLIAAMAAFSANNPGFNPVTATQMPSDTALQTELTAAWHH